MNLAAVLILFTLPILSPDATAGSYLRPDICPPVGRAKSPTPGRVKMVSVSAMAFPRDGISFCRFFRYRQKYRKYDGI
jgi:hypothetical protein